MVESSLGSNSIAIHAKDIDTILQIVCSLYKNTSLFIDSG